MTQESTDPSVVTLSPRRHEEAAEVLARAFTDDPVAVSILRGLTVLDRQRRLKTAYDATLQAVARRGELLCVDDDTIRAVAIVHPAGASLLPMLTQTAIAAKVVLKWGFHGLGRYVTWESRVKHHRPKDPHVYLEHIGVDPDYQGQGLGSAILEYLTSSADPMRTVCYLETGNARNVSLYERHGFKVIAEEVIIGVRTCFMLRKPRSWS